MAMEPAGLGYGSAGFVNLFVYGVRALDETVRSQILSSQSGRLATPVLLKKVRQRAANTTGTRRGGKAKGKLYARRRQPVFPSPSSSRLRLSNLRVFSNSRNRYTPVRDEDDEPVEDSYFLLDELNHEGRRATRRRGGGRGDGSVSPAGSIRNSLGRLKSRGKEKFARGAMWRRIKTRLD